MRSLFGKIFLAFWVAMALIVMTTLLFLAFIKPPHRFIEDRRLAGLALEAHGQRVARMLEHRAPEALMAANRRFERRTGMRAYIFDEQAEILAGQDVPEAAAELAATVKESGLRESRTRDDTGFLARRVQMPDGSYYIVVGKLPEHPEWARLWRLLKPRTLAPRLAATFVIAGIVSYVLAWHLTYPIRKLKTATRKFARGDLKTRVGPGMGRRRDEIAEFAHDFDVMAERVESLISAQSRLIRDISHELRSPLARLNVALELARQRAGAEAGEALERIGHEAERLNELIGQMVTLTLLESGAERVKRTSFDLTRLVKEIVVDADFEARSLNRSVKVISSEEITINASEEMLRRAIENVARNALRYTADGTEVEVSLRRQHENGGERAVLMVRDHGAGVPQESLANLFQPFYRVDEARGRESGGVGIGLAIAERAVRLHGGHVAAANASDGGLIIEISLPI